MKIYAAIFTILMIFICIVLKIHVIFRIIIRLNNKVILGDKYYIYDLEIIKKFKLYNNTVFINYVARYGHINILEWCKNSGLPLQYSSQALNLASKYGHINVLDWWKNSGLKLKYTKKTLLYIGSRVGREWLENSRLPFQNIF
jgi:hypothetical protein